MFSELNVHEDITYMCKVRFNSKKVIWQPCKLVMDSVNGMKLQRSDDKRKVVVQLCLSDKQKEVFITEKDGILHFVDALGKPTLKEMNDKWLISEQKRLTKELAETPSMLENINKLL